MFTLGTFILALQVQEGAAPLAGTGDVNVIDILESTGPVNRTVLAILVLLSVVSWAIILARRCRIGPSSRQSATFLDVFRRSAKFSEVQAVCPSLPASPLVGVFQAGYAELNAQFRADWIRSGQSERVAFRRPTLKSLPAVDRALLRASTVEVSKLEKRVTFLATIASVAPFIGLFGTVWGIMIAFLRIGAHRRDEPRDSRTGHLGSAHRDGARAVRGHPGGAVLQPLHHAGERVRRADGRLLARVPEHRRAEFHVGVADAQSDCDDSVTRRRPPGAWSSGVDRRSRRSTSSRSST